MAIFSLKKYYPTEIKLQNAWKIAAEERHWAMMINEIMLNLSSCCITQRAEDQQCRVHCGIVQPIIT